MAKVTQARMVDALVEEKKKTRRVWSGTLDANLGKKVIELTREVREMCTSASRREGRRHLRDPNNISDELEKTRCGNERRLTKEVP